MLACIGLHWLLLANVGFHLYALWYTLVCIGLCWPVLAVLACIGCCWLMLACIGLIYRISVVNEWIKKNKNIPGSKDVSCHLGPSLSPFFGWHWLLWAFIGMHWYLLACNGLCWLSLAVVGLHWPNIFSKNKNKTYLGPNDISHHLDHPYLVATMGFHWYSLAFIGIHWPALVIVGLR